MCQAVLGASNISKDPCPPSRETSEARVNTVELSAMLAGEKSVEGEEKWKGKGGGRGRETRRRRADKGPREAVLGRMIETWGRNRGWGGHQREDGPRMVPGMLKNLGFLNLGSLLRS